MARPLHGRPLYELTLREGAVAALAIGVLSLVFLIIYSRLEGSALRGAYESALRAQAAQVADRDLEVGLARQRWAFAEYLSGGTASLPAGIGEDRMTTASALAALAALDPGAGSAGLREAAIRWQDWAATQSAAPTPADLDRGRQLQSSLDSAEQAYAGALADRSASATALARHMQERQEAVTTLGVLLAAASMLALAAMVAGWILRPLHRLAQLARRVAGGVYGRVPYERRGDEVGDLARALSSWQEGDRERARLARRVSLSEARLKLIFDRAPVGICRIGNDGAILDANPALLAMFGCSLHQLVSHNLAELTHADDLAGNRRLYRELETGGRTDGAALTFERRYLRADGTQFWGTLTVTRVAGDGDEPDHFIGMVENISRRKARETDLEARALYDPLTGLPNRGLLADRVEHAIADAQRRGAGFTVILLDLDGFKAVNDGRGHQAGDEVLIEVASRLRAVTRAADTVARLGGDEFVVVLPQAITWADAQTAARKLMAVFDQPVVLSDGGSARIGSSLGCAIYPKHGADPQALLMHADRAMYSAKRSGGGIALSDGQPALSEAGETGERRATR